MGACAPIPYTPAERATYTNPVLERDFPDPALVRAADGWFYAYGTQTSTGPDTWNIQVARSRDLVRWAHLGDALPKKPAWASAKQNFWAPHVVRDATQGKYFMYYSVEPDAAKGKCLGVATSTRASGPFVDSGKPLLCGEGIEQIDPMAFDDPRSGKRLLYWGSGGKPIKAQELAPDRMGFLPGSTPVELVSPNASKPYRSLIEGAWVILRQGTYYLFYSGDRCCAREPSYAVMVARSGSPWGPFEELGAPLLERSAAWLAPGHNSVIEDDAGQDWIVYHSISAQRTGARQMLLDRIVYVDGWPRVAGNQPSSGARGAPIVRP